jgi:hypothetical protein
MGEKEKHVSPPTLGNSLILYKFHSIEYIWLTTPIIKILELKENYIKFQTKNSIYILTTQI